MVRNDNGILELTGSALNYVSSIWIYDKITFWNTLHMKLVAMGQIIVWVWHRKCIKGTLSSVCIVNWLRKTYPLFEITLEALGLKRTWALRMSPNV